MAARFGPGSAHPVEFLVVTVGLTHHGEPGAYALAD